MTSHMVRLLRCIVQETGISGPVLEIGSYIEPVQTDLNLRNVFPGAQYVGVDRNPGIGVDEHGDLLDCEELESVRSRMRPHVILCLYVLEHVWDIRGAAETLGKLWRADPETWMFIATHQNQPYHGYGPERPDLYDDFWRVTRVGMRRLMDEVDLGGGRLFLHPNDSNPEDVLLVRQPASMSWPGEALERAWRAADAPWEVR